MSHLTPEQRYLIAAMLNQGHKQKDIAAAINKDKSVVCREVRRNCDQRSGEYKDDLAQRKYDGRMTSKATSIRFTDSMKAHVIEELCRKKSPDKIRGTAIKMGWPNGYDTLIEQILKTATLRFSNSAVMLILPTFKVERTTASASPLKALRFLLFITVLSCGSPLSVPANKPSPSTLNRMELLASGITSPSLSIISTLKLAIS